MALSFCSNWGTLQPLVSSETSLCPQMQPELSAELMGFHDNFAVSDTCIDPLFDTDQTLFLSDNVNVHTHLLPCLCPPADHFTSFIPQFFAPQDSDQHPYPYPYPKRQRSYQDSYYLDFTPGFAPSPCLLPPEFLVPLPDLGHQASGGPCGSVESVKKGSGGSLSAQSIAARQRRRKITEKTQELGKLIPGGHRMNTAEMFQAAFKYIKCLQAQVGLLELMGSFRETKEETFHSKELQSLVASPLIQEKLYSEEKCLIPKQFVKALATDSRVLRQDTAIVKEINQLIGTGDQYGKKGQLENEIKI